MASRLAMPFTTSSSLNSRSLSTNKAIRDWIIPRSNCPMWCYPSFTTCDSLKHWWMMVPASTSSSLQSAPRSRSPRWISYNSPFPWHALRTVPSLGSKDLPITFGTEDNVHTESITFDVANINLPYNIITSWLAITMFMDIPHYAYLVFKMSRPNRVMSVKVEHSHGLVCAEIFLTFKVCPRRIPCRTRAQTTGTRA
jgi:hypothetical protein